MKLNMTRKPFLVLQSPWFFAVDCLVFLIGFYLLTSVVTWFYKKTTGIHNSESKSKTFRLLYAFFIMSIVLGIAKSTLNVVYFFLPPPESVRACSALGRGFQFLHALGSSFLFLFLWLRQNSLYRLKVLSTLATKELIRFSWALLGVIIVVGIVGITTLLITSDETNYLLTNKTCHRKVTSGVNIAIVYASYAVILFMQGSLLFLFCNILHRHHTNMESVRTSCHSRGCGIKVLIKHCCYAAAISSTTSLILIILDAAFLRTRLTLQELYVIWDVEYTTNVLCILMCFKEWRKILWPWKNITTTTANVL